MSENEHTPEPDEPTQPVKPTQPTPENDTCKPITLNKNGKPRKTLTTEALEKLKLAREKANAIRQASCAKKHDDKTAILTDVIDKFEKGIISEIPPDEKPKKKSKKKTKIIVEQSSDDSDEFEPNDNIVFVKRVSRKKKEPVAEPVKEPEYVPPPAPTHVEPETHTPMLTAQEIALKNQYNAMFSGGFLNKRSFY
tara:strand:+ start:63 stop:647 length:585 start_codon:yes stop_codon:yes gene_type:complete